MSLRSSAPTEPTSPGTSHGKVSAKRLVVCGLVILISTIATHAQGPGFSSNTSDRWIVVLSGGINQKVIQSICQQRVLDGNCQYIFRDILTGVTGDFTEEGLQFLKDAFKGRISTIEKESIIMVSDPDIDHWGELERRKLLAQAQENPGWGLDLIDQRSLPLDSLYKFNETGKGVNVYVLDTGIRTTHSEFIRPDGSSRAVSAFSAIDGEDPEDCHGHGSHVAAVVGGNTFGVAKDVTLHSVKVLGCNGGASYISLLQGLEWLAANHVSPAVVVMSINGRRREAINVAIENLIKKYHIHVVVASGNSNLEACGTSPASVPSAITVGAVDVELRRYHKSNWGPCVDIHAPGVGILSAGYLSDDAELQKTGTSMACPFTAGVVCRYLERNPGAAAIELSQKLTKSSVKGLIMDDLSSWGTFTPQLRPGILDISSTPNQILHANLVPQATIHPSLIDISLDQNPIKISVKLNMKPKSPVTITPQVPNAWDETPVGHLEPSALEFGSDDYDQEKSITFMPRREAQGHYYIFLYFRSTDGSFMDALQAIRVQDHRPPEGDSIQHPREIHGLPFSDVGDTTLFTDSISYKPDECFEITPRVTEYITAAIAICFANKRIPLCELKHIADHVVKDSLDVIYSYTPHADKDVDITTCGSSFDTTLLVFQDVDDRDLYLFNDDSPTCSSNTENSSLSVRLKSGTTYYIVVDGYKAAAGPYTLLVEEHL